MVHFFLEIISFEEEIEVMKPPILEIMLSAYCLWVVSSSSSSSSSFLVVRPRRILVSSTILSFLTLYNNPSPHKVRLQDISLIRLRLLVLLIPNFLGNLGGYYTFLSFSPIVILFTKSWDNQIVVILSTFMISFLNAHDLLVNYSRS